MHLPNHLLLEGIGTETCIDDLVSPKCTSYSYHDTSFPSLTAPSALPRHPTRGPAPAAAGHIRDSEDVRRVSDISPWL